MHPSTILMSRNASLMDPTPNFNGYDVGYPNGSASFMAPMDYQYFDDECYDYNGMQFHDYGIDDDSGKEDSSFDLMTQLGNVHWLELTPVLASARVIPSSELSANDMSFLRRREKKLTILEEPFFDDQDAMYFPRPPLDWRYYDSYRRPDFMVPPIPPFVEQQMFNQSHMIPNYPPMQQQPQMPNIRFSGSAWQASQQQTFVHHLHLQRMKLIREQREEHGRYKKGGKKGKKMPKKPVMRRRHLESQRQTPSRDMLSNQMHKRISAVAASAVASNGGFSGFCGLLKVNPLFPDCRGRVSTVKELDGNTYFECANCGTRRRFLEEDELPRSRR